MSLLPTMRSSHHSITEDNEIFTTFPQTLRGERYYIVAYDTPHDKLRIKFSQACLCAGLQRVQLSHFVGCTSDVRANRLLQKMKKLINDFTKKQKNPSSEPAARLLLYRLDQGQAWFALHYPSERAQLSDPKDVMRPKRVTDYIQ